MFGTRDWVSEGDDRHSKATLQKTGCGQHFFLRGLEKGTNNEEKDFQDLLFMSDHVSVADTNEEQLGNIQKVAHDVGQYNHFFKTPI